MPENISKVEVHGCIVCGKLHDLLIVSTPQGKLVGFTPTGPGCHALPGFDRPLVSCNAHTAEQIEAALARHQPGPASDQDTEEY